MNFVFCKFDNQLYNKSTVDENIIGAVPLKCGKII